MIHTIVSLDDVFPQTLPEKFIRLTSGGYSEYCVYNGEERLLRLFSTVPSDYLKV